MNRALIRRDRSRKTEGHPWLNRHAPPCPREMHRPPDLRDSGRGVNCSDPSTRAHGWTARRCVVEADTRRLVRAPMGSDERKAFAAELADTNRRRALVLLPLMAIAHAIHVAVFRVYAGRARDARAAGRRVA